MGFLRNRRDEPAAGSRYRMRQRLLSIGDDYWIEHEDGSRAFRVDGRRFASGRRSCSRT